jgi:hypothetical protein
MSEASSKSADPFEYDDAAYVLGALSPADHAAFELHLRTCDACQARVREVRGVPALLAGIGADDLFPVEDPVAPPDTLLPGLLRRANQRRRRQRWLIGGLASVAAACLIALVVVVWPSSQSATAPNLHGTFAQVIDSPVQATATLTGKPWGTSIDVHCHYVREVDRAFRYDLVVYAKHGGSERVGSWALPPDKDIDFNAGTSFSPDQISKVEITLSNGTTVLRLKL